MGDGQSLGGAGRPDRQLAVARSQRAARQPGGQGGIAEQEPGPCRPAEPAQVATGGRRPSRASVTCASATRVSGRA